MLTYTLLPGDMPPSLCRATYSLRCDGFAMLSYTLSRMDAFSYGRNFGAQISCSLFS